MYWCLGGASCTLDVAITILDCIAHMHASISSNQCSQAAPLCSQAEGYVHRRFSNTMSMCTIWACARLTCHRQGSKPNAWAKGVKLLTVLFSRFHWGHCLSCGKMELLKRKVVCCGQLILYSTLDRWQWLSRWAHHAVTRQVIVNVWLCVFGLVFYF